MWHALARLCLRRLLLFVVVSIVSTIAIGAAPGDPLADVALSGQATRGGLDAMREARGLSVEPIDRVRMSLERLARFDLGDSALYGRPVLDLVLPRLWRSVVLTAAALTIAWAAAALASIWHLRGGPRLGIGLVATLMAALQAIPDVVVALAALSLLASSGVAWASAGSATPTAMVAGSLVLATVHLPTAWQHLHRTLQARLEAPWMHALRARGLARRRLVWHHAVRAGASPLLAVMGLGFGSLLSAGLVVEVLFGIPGIGALMLDAMLARDTALALGGVMASSAAALAALTVADVLTLHVDPRTLVLEAHP